MLMVGAVPLAEMVWSASVGVRVADLDRVLIDVIGVRAVQVAVV
jgi:hypothetical protein